MAATHAASTRGLLQRIKDLLQRHPDHVMLCPAGERGEELLPHVKALIYGLTPITDPRTALRSPLSESSCDQLVMCCKDLATAMESRFRGGQPIRALKDDLDNLGLLSDALDLSMVTASYSGVCKLLADHICSACRGGQEAFRNGQFPDARHYLNLIEGFESLKQHYAAAYPDLRAREYVTLMTEINQAVLGWQYEVLDASMTLESLLPRLNALKGVNLVLRELLTEEARGAYKRAVVVAGSRFSSAAQDARGRVGLGDLRHEQLNALLDEMRLMHRFEDHLEDGRYYEECVQRILSLLDEAHVLLMQGLEERIEVTAAAQLRARLDMLDAASGLKECHAPDAQRYYAECIRQLDAACNREFARVDSSLVDQSYEDAADGLGQLRLLDLRGDAELQSRLQNKMCDVQSRLKNEFKSVRSMLGNEIPDNQNYACAVDKIHKLFEALEILKEHLARDASVQFEEELRCVSNKVTELHRVVMNSARQNLGLMLDSDSEVEGTQSTEDPKELARSLSKIEFMLSTKLNFDNELLFNCAHLKATVLTCFGEKCDRCLEHTRSASNVNDIDQIQADLSLLKIHADECRKLTGRGETLRLLFSVDNRASNQDGTNRNQVSSEQVKGKARTASKQWRAKSSASGLQAWCGVVGSSSASDTCSTGKGEGRRSIGSLEELAGMLETVIAQAISNLVTRSEELELRCANLLNEAKFEELRPWLELLSSFKVLEPLAQAPLTDRYQAAVSSVRSMLSELGTTFEDAIRANNMEQASKVVITVRNMIVLKDHVPPIEEVLRRVNSGFHEKTSSFQQTMNELLETKHYSHMSKLLVGHSQLVFTMPSARHELDCAQQQLADFFKIRFDNGWSTIQSIVPTKRMPDHKVKELAEITKNFTDAQQVFEVLTEQKFKEWTDLLTKTLLVKIVNIVQHGENCIHNLDIRGFDGCVQYLESLQVVSLVAEVIGDSMNQMDSSMQKRIEGLDREVCTAIERTEYRVLDKIFNGLKRGLEVNNTVAGKALDYEYEHLQEVLEKDLKKLCAEIRKFLDNHKIKEAHTSIDKFKSLLVSEAVRATEYNRDTLAKFQSDMDEIKQEVMSLRMVTEDPETINICLEGFKEIDNRWALFIVDCVSMPPLDNLLKPLCFAVSTDGSSPMC